ncbi:MULTISPECIES: F0F1 ATP synthase subunit B [unclassified Serinicoccus]|uniref:F0F1 ATP synthase subunit B n=1 Tax=unclassified Serinicoccus TaxID=2643101 RepID=UPI00385241F1
MSPILPYIPELVFAVVAFLIFYVFIRRVISPRLEQVYADRTAAIEGGMEKAEKAQAEAEAARRQYEDQLADARSEAARIREHAKEQGAEIIAEMRQQASAEAARITETAHKQIEAERQQAMVQLRGEIGQISTDLASKIVGESLEQEARQRGIIDRFLADLDSGAVQPEKLGVGEQGR